MFQECFQEYFISQVTGLYIVPPILLFLNACTYIKKQVFESMHHFISGAAPLSQTDVENFYQKYQLNADQLKLCQGKILTLFLKFLFSTLSCFIKVELLLTKSKF